MFNLEFVALCGHVCQWAIGTMGKFIYPLNRLLLNSRDSFGNRSLPVRSADLAPTATNMSTPAERWLAAEPNYIPRYSDTQQIIGTTVLATVVAITVLTFVIVYCRRGR